MDLSGANKVKAIILAGGENARLYPLTRACPRPLLPFLNRPLVVSQVESLRQHGFTEIGVAVSSQDADAVKACLGDGRSLGVRVIYAMEDYPRGPAGCLKSFQDFIGEGPFLVINGGVAIGSIDLTGLADFHVEKKAGATLAMPPEETSSKELENVVMTPDGRIRSFTIPYPSKDQRRHRRFAGIYLFDRCVFQFIRGDSYMDIKGQLLPALSSAGGSIYSYTLHGVFACFDTPEEYYRAQHAMLSQGAGGGETLKMIGDAVWASEGTHVASSAYVIGPVVMGKSCSVEGNARIIGPAVIGDGSAIGEGSLLRESIIWSRVHVSDRSRVEYAIIGSDCSIAEDQQVSMCVMMSNRDHLAYPLMNGARKIWGGTFQAAYGYYDRESPWGSASKRAMDLVISAAALIACAPILLVIGLAIKLDSRGPVIFLQRRCGRHGREFSMYKFRTMVQNADNLQEQYQFQKDVDGPMFKLREDPRVTPLGRLLRRFSLDELPQLVNVLKGDMSLVGPRPLIMEEMKFCPAWRDFRLTVLPGITGLWQVNGRSQGVFHDWIRYDIQYVKYRTFGMDLKILAKTLWVVVKRTGAY